MFHVSGPFRRVLHLAVVADDLLQQAKSFIQINPLPYADVEHASRNFGCRRLAGEQIRLHRVVDVSEVAALGAVSENRRLFSTKHLGDEFSQHAGIWGIRILPRPKNIEVAQADGFQAVAAVKRRHVVLAGKFGDRVRRDRIRRHVFVLRQSRCVAVGRRRRRVYHPLDLRIPRRYQEVHRAVQVCAVAGQRILY